MMSLTNDAGTSETPAGGDAPWLPAWERDPYRREASARIVAAGHDGRFWAELDDSIFYPEGGGQPPDRGAINDAEVIDVQRAEHGVRHYTSRALEPGRAHLRLDWIRRFDHMQHHTGQHLLSALALKLMGWRTTAFHLGETLASIELDTPRIGEPERVALEAAVAEAIREAHPVRAARVSRQEYAQLEVRSRGMPEDLSGGIRLIEIAGIDRNTCGGTHLRSTAEIEVLCLVGTEPMRGGTRLGFVAGRRARARMADHEARNVELRTLLGAPDPELAEAARSKLDQLRAAARRVRELESELASTTVAGLTAAGQRLVEGHFPSFAPSFLRELGKLLLRRAPDGLALLTSGRAPDCFFLLVADERSGLELGKLGARVAAILGARGGGAGPFYQGKAADLARRDEAVAYLRGQLS